jgi:ABC-type lipoprotein export system ATPase subunit
MEYLKSLHDSGKTIVVVTHDLRVAQYATQIVYILDGQLVTEAEYLAATQMQKKLA